MLDNSTISTGGVWFATVLAIIGAGLNARGNPKGFLIWVFTNTFFLLYNFFIEEYAQSLLFLVYLCISIYGYRRAK